MWNSYIAVNNKKTAYRIIDEEATVVNLKDSTFHTLNPVATFIWQQLDGKKQLKTIVDEICLEFDVDENTAKKDCVDFIQALLKEELVSKSSEPIEEY